MDTFNVGREDQAFPLKAVMALSSRYAQLLLQNRMRSSILCVHLAPRQAWPAPGSEYTELGALKEQDHEPNAAQFDGRLKALAS
jgi:hypothetical protein